MRPALTADDERVALRFDPWAGDMDSDAVTLRDAFVTARKSAECAICLGDIQPGDRVRAQTQRSEEMRKVMTFRFCDECCRAMVVDSDHWEIAEARYALGMDRARERRKVEGTTP